VTRETGDVVLVTDATLRRLRRDHGGFAARGSVALRGKADRVRLHTPLAAVRPERPALRIVEPHDA
jgi:adenylate cyclase